MSLLLYQPREVLNIINNPSKTLLPQDIAEATQPGYYF